MTTWRVWAEGNKISPKVFILFFTLKNLKYKENWHFYNESSYIRTQNSCHRFVIFSVVHLVHIDFVHFLSFILRYFVFFSCYLAILILYACVLSHFSCVRLFVSRWTVAHQAPLSMGFPRQEYCCGLPCPPPRDLPEPGIKPASLMSPSLAGRFFTPSITWEDPNCLCC